MKHEWRVRRVDYPRSAPPYRTSSWRLAVSVKVQIRCCVRCPVTPFGFARHAEAPDGDSQLPAPTVRPGRVTRFWPFGPVADDVGLTRRYQRSTCVTAALPAPRQERENSLLSRRFCRDLSSNSYRTNHRSERHNHGARPCDVMISQHEPRTCDDQKNANECSGCHAEHPHDEVTSKFSVLNPMTLFLIFLYYCDQASNCTLRMALK